MGYFKDAVKGVSWMTTFRVSTRAIAYVKIAVLARVLLPEQFGIYGIASLLLAFLETFTETGINVFFIQGEGKLKDYVDTAWVISIIRGTLIAGIILLTAPYIADFFHEPGSLEIIYLMASVPFIRAFINPSEVKYKKDLKFKKEFLFRTSIFFVDAFVAIVLAFILKNPSSLVYGMVAGALFETLLSFVIFTPNPKLTFDFNKAREVISRGKWVSLSKTTGLAYKEGDDVFVGRMLDASSLGIYQVAYKISTLPLTEVGQVIGSVTFPVYTKISGDVKRLRKAYSKVLLTVLLLTLPVGLILYFFPGIVIRLLLGSNWLEAIPLLKILAAFGVFRALSSTTKAVYLSIKKQEYGAYVSTVSFLGMVTTIAPLIQSYGVMGAAYSAFVGLGAGMVIDIYLTLKSLKIIK